MKIIIVCCFIFLSCTSRVPDKIHEVTIVDKHMEVLGRSLYFNLYVEYTDTIDGSLFVKEAEMSVSEQYYSKHNIGDILNLP